MAPFFPSFWLMHQFRLLRDLSYFFAKTHKHKHKTRRYRRVKHSMDMVLSYNVRLYANVTKNIIFPSVYYYSLQFSLSFSSWKIMHDI